MANIITCRNGIYPQEFSSAVNSIKNGNLVIFPTETVYGIGANAYSNEAVSKIFEAKGRQSDNPLIVHISDFGMLDDVAKNFGYIEMQLANTFWPGPLTIIFEKKDIIPNNVTANLDTVAVRMPDNVIALKLIRESKMPIAAPSANVSGRPSGTKISDIANELGDKVDYMIDGGDTVIGVESTVVKVKDDKVIILRPGKITKEDIEECGFQVEIDKHIFEDVKEGEKVESPGMKHRHYAPKKKCIMIEGNDNAEKIAKINNIISNNPNIKIGVMAADSDKENLMNCTFVSYGQDDNYDIIAHNIFTKLREVDNYDVDVMLIKGVDNKGIGLAIYNRLIRACEYNKI